MANTSNLSSFLTDVAGAIREKKGTQDQIPAGNFDTEIKSIETGIDTSDATATVDDVISPETFYSNGQKLTGAIIPTYEGDTFYPDKTMTSNFIIQSANFELGIGIRMESGGLKFGKLVDNRWSIVKTFTTSELGTGALAIYRAILFPYKDSNTTIKVLITSSTSIYGGFSIYGRIYELDFTDIDNPTITLLKTSGVLSSNRAERGNGRADQIKLVWLTNSICMLVQSYAPGYGYPYQSFYFRSLKIHIADDNTMTVTDSRTRTLATDVYGDDWGGTPAGIVTAYRSGNYVISVANKNYRSGDSGNWYYITIITDWANNVDYQITNTSDIGYVVYNGLVYGNNKICRVTSPTTTLYTTTISGLSSRFNYSVNGYAFMGTSSALKIYKLEAERASLLDAYDDYGDTHLSEDGKTIYSNHINSWTKLITFALEQKLASFIRKNIIYSDTSNSTAVMNNVLSGKIFYNSLGLQTGAMPNNGKLNYTPTEKSQTIPAGYTSGGTISAVTSAIDQNIQAGNIKSGVTILGVEGTLGIPDNSFADASAEIYNTIQNQYENMEPRILTDDDKTINKNIYFIPVKKDGTPLLDTSNVTNMSWMFDGCTNLTTIPLLNTSNVTNMQSMFGGCSSLTTIPLLDTSNATNMNSMFGNCSNLTTIPELDTSNVMDMNAMFTSCSSLTTIPELDTSKVTDMAYMFNGCTNLTTIPLLNTSNVTNMNTMFDYCTNLTTIPLLNTSKVTNMTYMLNGCTNLTTIPELDTSNVMDMAYMFGNCSSLSDDSLNIIMQMCINATFYTDTKTLKDIGLTSEQADKCKTLSNYSAFTSAGWTTGY